MNNFLCVNVSKYDIYKCSLAFNEKMIQNIIKDIYELENHPDKLYHSEGRTFKINNGFHSCNLLDKKYGILEKYENLRILVSRVQELLYNHFEAGDITFVKNKTGNLRIYEIWINILRVTDYNLPHNHSNYDISGNFYLQTNNKKNQDTDGGLAFLNYDTVHYTLPNDVLPSESNIKIVSPVPNLGVIFQSHFKHVVLPHFSDEDRIGIAFNAKYDYTYAYDNIYPIPYWFPIKYKCLVKEEYIDEDNKLNIPLKNGTFISLKIDDRNKYINKVLDLGYDNLKGLLHTYKNNVHKAFLDNTTTVTKKSTNDDYFSTENPKWSEKDHYYYEDNNSDTLMVVFSGMGSEKSIPTFIFYNFLKEYNCDKLFLRDLTYSWFLNNSNFQLENKDISKNTESNVDKLKYFILQFIKPRHKRKFSMGASAGGFGSIFYSNLLNFDKCIAFAPQTIIGQQQKLKFKDTRWEEVHQNIKKVNKTYFDLKNLFPFNTETDVYYSFDLDGKHAKHIQNKKCKVVKIDVPENENENKNKHLTALIMKRSGMLKKIIDDLFN